MNLPTSFAIDNSAILFLAQRRKDHANSYRFAVTLKFPVDPDALQQAADRMFARFPTIVAGFRPRAFSYEMVPASRAPRVRKDPGLLLTMEDREIQTCAYRIYYEGHQIIIEAFHALTDGYGAIASLRALLAEYLHLRHGLHTEERKPLLEKKPDWEEELRDAYLDNCGKVSGGVSRQPSYQLVRTGEYGDIQAIPMHVPTKDLLQAARDHGVTMTTFLAGLMAEAIMERQHQENPGKKRPVRIMVPIDLRRLFPCRTFRNFVLYALPTLKPEHACLSRHQRLADFKEQLRQQFDRKPMAEQITRNVRVQRSLWYRCLPRAWKCALLRLSYHFFGEINSSITLTNLGPMPLSGEMCKHIEGVDVFLTPRRRSPYNCGVLSCGDVTSITISRFGSQTELETLFFEKLRSLLPSRKEEVIL